jgi:hypothetical protein
MQVKVIKIFRDKNTRILHAPGETLEVTKERYHEINGTVRGKFVEGTSEEVKKPATKKK